MTTYYISENGGAANKAASTAVLGMSIAVHNAETFAAGDIIIAFDDGGAITSRIIPPSSGSAGNPITYEMAAIECNPSTGGAFLLTNIDYVTVNDVNGNGNGDDAYCECSGTAGAGTAGEITNILNNPRILSNGGGTNTDCDGISLNDTARLIVNNPYIRDCFNTSAPTTGSHQALTAHTDSVLVANNVDIDNVTAWCVNTSNARITVNGGSMSGAKQATLESGSNVTADGRMTVINVTMTNNQGARPPAGTSTASANAMITIIGGSWVANAAASQANNRNVVTFLNVTFISTDNTLASFEHHTITTGLTNVIGCNFGEWASNSGYTWRIESGHMNFEANTVVSADLPSGRFLTADSAAGASMTVKGGYMGQIIDVTGQGFIWLRGTAVGNVDIEYVVFGGASVFSERLIDNDGVINRLVGNKFINITNVIDTAGGGSVTTQYGNDSINSETVDIDLLEDEITVSSLIAQAQSASGASSGRPQRAKILYPGKMA